MTSATPKPRAGEHTPGPWKVCEQAFNGAWSVGNTIYSAMQDGVPYRVADTSVLNPDSEANARRIVACVNACEGMNTLFLKGRNWSQDGKEAWAEYASQVKAERDLLRERERELVELLKAHLAHTTQSIKDIGGCDHSVGICCCDMIRDCDAASALLAKPRP